MRDAQGQVLRLEPDLVQILADSRDYDTLAWAWDAWREAASGPDTSMKDLFEENVVLQNAAVRAAGSSPPTYSVIR